MVCTLVPELTPAQYPLSAGRRPMRRSICKRVVAVAILASAQPLMAGQALPRTLYDRALVLERRDDAAGALALLWEAAGLAPRDGDIQNELGGALERIGALDAAADAYRAAADAPSAPASAARNLVLVLVKAGRSPEAIARAKAGVDRAPA